MTRENGSITVEGRFVLIDYFYPGESIMDLLKIHTPDQIN